MALNVAAAYAGGDCNKMAISINATKRAPALKSCITEAPRMNFHTTFSRVRAGVLQLHQAYMSKTQVATEITRLQADIPKEGSLKSRVLPIRAYGPIAAHP